ncbi:hypothetical protein [Microbacterium sp. SORGH_AS_0862]|uniref:hypothetical protein n=1 Tax=Microbacterium sp. SORGH_AS_0862 TaxID=3041789 RepID=UPI0027938239|nr:hypothetical protein [Microbacterium sp. SORGH_AS_0862]MDQ1206189.1 hypothetical protein [Microbacterium sp. SORGH_AS_0862]
MEPTPLPPPRGAAPSTLPTVLGLPVEAAPTAVGLRLLAGEKNLLQLNPTALAAQLYPTEPIRSATERVILHVVMLEEAGHLSTWIADGQEWLSMTPPSNLPRSALRASHAPSFSPAGEREGEGARARARARERAQAQVDAEERERAVRWAAWNRDQTYAAPRRPDRPALLDAPPIGCPDHPNGHYEPCGPCGTAAARRREYLARHTYLEQLSIFEEQTGGADDEPF